MSYKQEYFNEANLRQKTTDLLEEFGNEQRKPSINFLPDKSTLLILDMVEYFLSTDSNAYIPSAKAILPNIHRLIGFFLKQNRPVILTRHINTDQNAGMMNRWWKKLITVDDPQSKIISEFDTYDLRVLTKEQYDAFHNTSLKDILIQSETSQVVITGVMTHICCESTARSAFTNGFEVFFPVDGTATYNEEYHRASLLNLSHGFAIITYVDRLINQARSVENI